MAVTKTINGTVSQNANLYTYQLYCEEINVDQANNSSKLKVTVRIVTGGSSGVDYAERYQSATHTVTINGTTYSFTSGNYSLIGQTTTTLGSVTSNTIKHNDDGTKTVNVSANSPDLAQGGGYGPYSGSASGSVTLTSIPRYATITKFSVAQRDETSLAFSFTTNAICDYVWYSTNNGSTWTGVDIADGTSGSFNVTGLVANTSYNCKLRVRRKDSQLNTDSNVVEKSTYDYPKVANIGSNPLIIGNSQTLTLYNPLSRSVTVKMYKNNTSGTQLYSGSTSTTSITFTPNDGTLYNSIPNNAEANCVYTVTYGSSTKVSTTATYKIKGNEYPTFSESDFTYTANLTALTNNNQLAIDKYANITVTINTPASSSYGSTIDKYIIKWGDATPVEIAGDATSGTISAGNGNALTITAYDKRGLPNEAVKTITNLVYTDLTINTNSASASRNNGVDAETKLSFTGKMFNGKFGDAGVTNALYHAKYYVSTNGTTWSNAFPNNNTMRDAIVVNNGNLSLTNFLIHANGSSGGFTIGQKYYVKIEIKDASGQLSTATTTVIVTDGKIARDVYQDGNGDYHEGINGLANSNYTEDIHGSLNATNIYKNGNALPTFSELFPIGSIIETYTSTNPSGTYSGTWQRYGTGRVTVDVDTSDSNFNSIGKEGGANSSSYTPAGTIGGTAISVNQMPSHNHSHIYWGGKVQSGYEIGIDNNGIGGFRLSGGWSASNANTTSAFFVTGNSGGGQTHTHSWTGTVSTISRLQKYITVYRWRRTA